ncbi:hypothetical protein ACFLYF_00520 [Chloroflexota bacterium]
MGYWQRRRQEKLYKQWAKHAELSREVAAREFTPREFAPDEFVMPPAAVDDSKVGIDVKGGFKEDDWFYQFRVKIRDAVGKLLRVD